MERSKLSFLIKKEFSRGSLISTWTNEAFHTTVRPPIMVHGSWFLVFTDPLSHNKVVFPAGNES